MQKPEEKERGIEDVGRDGSVLHGKGMWWENNLRRGEITERVRNRRKEQRFQAAVVMIRCYKSGYCRATWDRQSSFKHNTTS